MIHTGVNENQRLEASVDLVRQVSDLDLDRFCQVADGDVPHAARHHIADQCASGLLALKTTDSRHQSVLSSSGPGFVGMCGPTWNRLVLLKNMKLILDIEESSASVRVKADSSEAGRVTWANGFICSASKWICRGEKRGSGGPGPS